MADVDLKMASFGGCSNYRLVTAASTNLTSVKTSQARLFGFIAANISGVAYSFKIYDKASAPVPASDTPIISLIVAAGANVVFNIPHGIYLANGLAFSATGGAADTDATAASANNSITMLYT